MPAHTPAFTGFSTLGTRSYWYKPRQRRVSLLFLPGSSPQVSLDFQAISDIGALAPLLPQWVQSHYVILRATSVSSFWHSFLPGCSFVNMKTLSILSFSFFFIFLGSFDPETPKNQRIDWNQLRLREEMNLGLFCQEGSLFTLAYSSNRCHLWEKAQTWNGSLSTSKKKRTGLS